MTIVSLTSDPVLSEPLPWQPVSSTNRRRLKAFREMVVGGSGAGFYDECQRVDKCRRKEYLYT